MDNIAHLKEDIRHLKVLFVDDEDDIRKCLGLLLGKFFDKVTICADGEEGLEAFKESPDYDIVITDVVMPRMDGNTMVDHIKKISPDVFTVFITASRELKYKGEENCSFCIRKPVSFDDLMAIMKKIHEEVK